MRKSSLVMVLALLLSLTLAFAVNAQDEEEDLSQLVFPVLTDGEPLSDVFEGTVTARVYAFNGSEGDEVTITMTQAEDSLLDPYLVLLGSAGEVLAYDDDSGEVGLSSAITEFELPADGTYYLLATAFNELRSTMYTEEDPIEEPLEYEILVTGSNIPDGVDAEELQFDGLLLELEDGVAEGVLTIQPETPVAYLGFLAEEGQTITITTAPAEDSDQALTDPLLYVFDARGSRLAVVDDVPESDNFLFPAVEFEAPYTGVYLLFVTVYGFQFTVDDPSFEGGDVFVNVTVE
jgi:hypothetical protein